MDAISSGDGRGGKDVLCFFSQENVEKALKEKSCDFMNAAAVAEAAVASVLSRPSGTTTLQFNSTFFLQSSGIIENNKESSRRDRGVAIPKPFYKKKKIFLSLFPILIDLERMCLFFVVVFSFMKSLLWAKYLCLIFLLFCIICCILLNCIYCLVNYIETLISSVTTSDVYNNPNS